MASRPSVTYESKDRLFEVAEAIDESEEERSFEEALLVVLEYAEEEQQTAPVFEVGDVGGSGVGGFEERSGDDRDQDERRDDGRSFMRGSGL